MDRFVALAGDVDHASRPEVEARLLRALDEGMDVIVDLRNVTLLDSAGLAALIAVRQRAEQRGLGFRVARPTSQVRVLLDTLDPRILAVVPEPPAPAAGPAAETDRAELETAYEELRVADEELRAQQELIDGLLTDRSSERLAGLRLVGALPVAVLETNRDGRIHSANPAAAGLFRYDGIRLRGKPVAVLVAQPDRRALRSAVSRALAGDGTEYLSVQLTPRYGASVPATVAVVGGTGPDGADPAAVQFVIAPHGTDSTDALLSAVGALSALSAVDGDVRESLARVVELAVAGIAGATAGSLVLGAPGEPTLVLTTDLRAQAGDGEQFRAGAGPSWEAYVTARPAASPDLDADGRWPALHGAFAEEGGAVAIPLAERRNHPAGVLTLYGTDALVEPSAVRGGAIFADAAAALLRQHDVLAELRQQEGQLRQALDSRATIDQAKGILMGRLGISGEAAWTELVRRSQDQNVKLREVARLVVEQAAGRPATVAPLRSGRGQPAGS